MAMTTNIQAGVANSVTAATTTPTSGSGSTSASSLTGLGAQSIAGNFQTFLTLLTTQLQNQDPTNPLDTNQFTQQLVEFAQVEQQLQSNSQLATLVSLQQTAQSSQALNFVGDTVTVNGNAAQLTDGQTSWTFNSPQPANATVNISNSTGQLVYSGNATLQTGNNTFSWNGQGSNGTQWPDGTYTAAVTAQSASGQSVAVSSQISGVVSSVNLSTNPPQLSINGQNFTISQITGVSKN
jgi:flagellar basal-body rod modification protein FlgD